MPKKWIEFLENLSADDNSFLKTKKKLNKNFTLVLMSTILPFMLMKITQNFWQDPMYCNSPLTLLTLSVLLTSLVNYIVNNFLVTYSDPFPEIQPIANNTIIKHLKSP